MRSAVVVTATTLLLKWKSMRRLLVVISVKLNLSFELIIIVK